MSAEQFDLGLRLRAYHQGKPVVRTSTRRFDVRREAMVVSALASPGDHSGVWGLAWAPQTGKPTAAVLGDPRPWGAQVQLWEQVSASWGPWIDGLAREGRYPQFVVADRSAATRISLSARKVAFSEQVAPATRAVARAFLVSEHLSRNPGQQSIATMSEVLAEHFISARDPLDERHLGLWAALPTLRPGWDAPQVALPPGMDASAEPLGRAWDRYIRALGDNEHADENAAVHLESVAVEVRRLVNRRWGTLLAATKFFLTHPGDPLPEVKVRRIAERKTFDHYYEAERTPSTKSAQSKWRTLATREEVSEAWQEALWTHDPLERARGSAAGDVLVGHAANGRVITNQQVVRVRPGDGLLTTDGQKFTVVDLFDHAEGIVVQTSRDDLEGDIVAWPAAARIRQPIPDTLPWTHTASAAPAPGPAPGGDLLARVQAMRATAL